MKRSKRILAGCMSALLLAPGFTGLAGAAGEDTAFPPAEESYFLVGRLQQEGSVASASQPGEGQVLVNIDSATLVDISGYDPADLAVQVELRATRHDGVTGENSLQWLRNGRLTLKDSAGAEVLQTGSPVQSGVPAADRVAGEWMTATFSLAGMSASSGKLASLSLFDYNDFPKQDPPVNTGMTIEARSARIVDTTRDADGTPLVAYEAAAFYQAEGTHPSRNNTEIRADWSNANTVLDAGQDRGRYILKMNLEFLSDDPEVDPAASWKQITVKLRSSDVKGKEDDPSGADNSEHNYGWDFRNGQSYDTAEISGAKVSLSIPLDTPSTNSRGIMDWTDIQRLICYVSLDTAVAEHMSMNISYARIVDMQAVAALKEQLKGVVDTPQDENLFSKEDLQAYQTIKQAAQALLEEDAPDPAILYNATAALKKAMLASDSLKEELKNWVSRETDWDLITGATREAYEQAAAAGQALLDSSGATRAAVEEAIQAAKDAWFALEFDGSLPPADTGNLDGKEGITASDALVALQISTGKIVPTAEQRAGGDVDGKEGITAADALMILQYATQKITAFPVDDDLSGAITAVENPDPLTACNPIDISYMFQRAHNDANREENQATYRESADPAAVFFNGKYYLFASHGDGYWSSEDLANWTFIRVDVPTAEEDPNFTQLNSQFRRYAPATCVVGDTLYLTHSEGGDILKTTNPDDPDAWELVRKSYGWMDPCMYYDDPADGGTGYVYLYMGLSHRDPIRVIVLDPEKDMEKVDGPYDCCWPDNANRGYAVPGDTNTDYTKYGVQEGPWMVKYEGKYYLTCAVGGTQYATYSDDCFVSDSPTGPFVYCENSPAIFKATGFVQGAGHGCLFQDENGRWWKVDTSRIAGFERRLGIYPAIFDEDGELYTNTVMSDYPFYIPTESQDPFNDPGPGWNLLSYGKEATASSGEGSASLAFNENMSNAWVADTGDEGEWLQVDLGRVYGVWSVQVNFADKDFTGSGGRDNGYAYRYLMEFSQDGETWYTMVDRTEQTEDLSHEYIEFTEKVGARYIRITNKGEVPAGGKFAISGLRVFGEGGGRTPAGVDMDTVIYERRADNNRSIGIAWEAAPGAQGYIIRYGTSPDKLYTHYQVIGDTSKVINSLVRGVDYYFTIDSYNENGVTQGTEVLKAEATEELQEYIQTGTDAWTPSPAETNKADGLTVHEAEQADFSGEGVTPEYEVRASRQTALHGMGVQGSYASFTGVDGGEGGEATLRVSYATPKDAGVTLLINGQAAGTLTLPKTTGWPTFATADFAVTGLTPGETNTIRLEGSGDLFILDWVQVIYTLEDETHEPGEIIGGLSDPAVAADYLVYEAEEASLGNDPDADGSVSVGNDEAASGGKSVHSMEKKGAYVEFSSVDGGAGGTGILRLGYSCGNAVGDVTIYINGKQLGDGAYALPNTGGWPTFKAIQIALDGLNPGTGNTVRLEGGGMGFNPDYIQVLPDDKGDHYGETDPADPFDGMRTPVQIEEFKVYEAEDAEIGNDPDADGSVSVANDVNASGGKSVHGMEKKGAYVEFHNVDGGEGGSGRLRLSYCEGNLAGAFRLLVNGELVVETSLKNTGTWNDFMMVEFALEDLLPGETNTIRLECGGAGYNPDWIQILY